MSSPIPSLFDPPDPPTGPPTDVSKFRNRYAEWRAGADGVAVVAYVTMRALAVAADEKRVSVRTLTEDARAELHVEVNDHYSPLIADELVSRHPQLLPVVERRRRRFRPSAGAA